MTPVIAWRVEGGFPVTLGLYKFIQRNPSRFWFLCTVKSEHTCHTIVIIGLHVEGAKREVLRSLLLYIFNLHRCPSYAKAFGPFKWDLPTIYSVKFLTLNSQRSLKTNWVNVPPALVRMPPRARPRLLRLVPHLRAGWGRPG